jgi:hypothetical protein
MNRFGEIPINPDVKQDRPGKKKQEPENLPAEPGPALSPETDLAAEQPEAAPEVGQGAELDVEAVAEHPTGPGAVPDTYSPSPRSRSARKKKKGGNGLALRVLSLLVAVPLGIVLLYTVGSYVLVPYYIKGPLARSVGQRLERPVTVSRAVFSPFTLRLFLEDITIGPVAGDRSEQQLLECARIDCRITLDRIFSGILVCEGIKVNDLLMQVNRDAAVSSDLDSVWRLIVPSANMTRGSLWPEWLLPGEITLTGGTVLVDDPAARKQYRIEQIELYLPPLDPNQVDAERLPRLSALINGSPVQMEAVRGEGSNGQTETRFDLKITSVVLANYLQTLPVLEQRLKLVEGQADMELRIIFPQTGSGGQRILLEGSSTLSAVKIVDTAGKAVFSVPSASLHFQIAPLSQRYRFPRITLDNPLLNLSADAGEEKQAGLTMQDLGKVLLTPVRLPLNLGVDQLQVTGGQVHVSFPDSAQKELAWKDVTYALENFASPGVSLEEKKGGPTRFTFNMTDSTGTKAAKLAGEGEILADGSIKGQVSLDQFDFVRYQDLLPRTGLGLSQGRGDLHFTFESLKPVFGDKEEKEASSVFMMRGGELHLVDYILKVGGQKAAAGGTLHCDALQLEPAARQLTCSTLELADSEIFHPVALTAVLGKPAKGTSWQLDARNLRVKGARLHVPLLQSLCSAEKDLVLKDFTAEAKDLVQENGADNITAQASVGAKGSVKVSGGYSLEQNKGSLRVDLQHLDFALFDPCLSQTVIPKVKQGTINIQGNVSLPAKEFSGQIWVNDMVAGEEDGPSVSWKLATSDRVILRTDPAHLDLGEIMVRKPSLQAGLIDSENLVRNFLQPGKPSFQKLAIGKVSIEDGQFSPFWPVLLPGYQPRLEGINGSLSALGQKSMPFSLSGKVGDLGNFKVAGKTGLERLESYTLDMPSVSLVPFAEFFLTNMGMSVETAQGKWQQTMTRADNVAKFATDIRFQGLLPVAESPLILITALRLGKNGELLTESKEDVADGTEPPFLLTSVQRQLQRESVRADISEELVLREYFPELQLPGRISFAPGLAQPLSPEGLAGYKELFGLRPYLGLRLHAVVDNATDREALRQILQEEADLKREAENSRRALIKLQREEREKKRLAELKNGNAPVVVEKIPPDELAGDLEPLPYVQVEVTEAMLAELAINRLHAVQGYLQKELAVDPARVKVGEGFSDGPPQVELHLVPSLADNQP